MRPYFMSAVVQNVQNYRKGADNLPNFLRHYQLTMLKLYVRTNTLVRARAYAYTRTWYFRMEPPVALFAPLYKTS